MASPERDEPRSLQKDGFAVTGQSLHKCNSQGSSCSDRQDPSQKRLRMTKPRSCSLFPVPCSRLPHILRFLTKNIHIEDCSPHDQSTDIKGKVQPKLYFSRVLCYHFRINSSGSLWAERDSNVRPATPDPDHAGGGMQKYQPSNPPHGGFF